MSIVRVVKSNRFSVISNAVLQDERLSYDAIGVAARLLSLPDGWRIREDYLVEHSPSGRGCVSRAMTELQTYGYLHRRRYQTRPGGPLRHDVTLYEEPHTCNCDNPACRNWHADGYAAPTHESPTAGFPTVGIPTVGEPAVIDSTYDQKLKEIDLDHDLDPSFSLKERATASTATASDSTPPTIVTELTNEQPTATGSTQQAEIDACLLAYAENGGRPLSAADMARFTTLVRTYTGAALIHAVSTAAAQADKTGAKRANKVNPNYLDGMLKKMAAEGKLDPENQAGHRTDYDAPDDTPFDQAALDAEMERTAQEREAKRQEREAERQATQERIAKERAEAAEQERIAKDQAAIDRERRRLASAADAAKRQQQEIAKRIAAAIEAPDQAGRIAADLLAATADEFMRNIRLGLLEQKRNKAGKTLTTAEATAILHGGLFDAAPARVAA